MPNPNKLYNYALKYAELGYSVIPIFGGNRPERFKAAAVRWTRFQRQHATKNQLENWFLDRQFGGLAIICGRISGLAVLDFDNQNLADQFAHQFPHLTQTYTVSSGKRNLPHLYFRVPSHLQTTSRSLPGVDWQFEGRYVIAPPTESSDSAWSVQCEMSPLTLTESDLSDIMRFLNQLHSDSSAIASNPVTVPSHSFDISSNQIVQFYLQHVSLGRNNALFKTCCWVRDAGGQISDLNRLIHIHAIQPALGNHPNESYQQREQEAIRTIESAFAHPAKKRVKPSVIPNSLREVMLGSGYQAVLRVLEAIFMSGWQSGQVFTRSELISAIQKMGIGNWSVRKALKSVTPKNEPFFKPANGANAAKNNGVKTPQLNAIELRVTEPTQKRGRAPQYFSVPSIRELCGQFDVSVSLGDALAPENLRSAKAYRVGLHAALLRRRPGQYTQDWLAQRLGVSVRTLNRYHQSHCIRVQPMFIEQPIHWKNVDKLIPADVDLFYQSVCGVFIQEDGTGKRYPPLLPIARRLLRQKKQISLMQQTRNHYSYCPEFVIVEAEESEPSFASQSFQQPLPSPFFVPPKSPNQAVPAVNMPPIYQPQSPGSSVNLQPRLDEKSQQIAQKLWELCGGTLSRQRAEALTLRYGRFAIEDVCDSLSERGNAIQNPGGFVVRLLDMRYGMNGFNGLTASQITAAESLYCAVKSMNPAKSLRWSTVQKLVKQYGEKSTVIAIKQLREASNVQNPAGFVLSILKALASNRAAAGNMPSQIHELIRQVLQTIQSLNPQRLMSRERAKSLVRRYGKQAVWQALNVVRSRSAIENPAGFMVAYLRSTYPQSNSTPD